MPQLLTQAETCEITRKSSSTLRRDIAAGKFPAPLKIGARRIAWRAEDVQRWLDGLNAAAQQQQEGQQ
ncbi:helix-turn-helix transcriptional regulator [Caldimonas tepidiphila]|uniref:helix-turn-helix transcriptional regulator n=1 Tax=Caldimonas tepidiphila TaxID=2315841 RepID=UPI000E5BA20D|nr:AlpA family phage regulatory protein [Caldimonas tepidiphila]